MMVYRLCDQDEITKILEEGSFKNVGHIFKNDKKNTHNYLYGVKYIHFFENLYNIFLYLNVRKNKFVCFYDIPEKILKNSYGYGLYLDFIKFDTLVEIPEFAVKNELIEFSFLKEIYVINKDFDLDYVPDVSEIMNSLDGFNQNVLNIDTIKNKQKLK